MSREFTISEVSAVRRNGMLCHRAREVYRDNMGIIYGLYRHYTGIIWGLYGEGYIGVIAKSDNPESSTHVSSYHRLQEQYLRLLAIPVLRILATHPN